MKYVLICIVENVLWFGLLASTMYGLFSHKIFLTEEQVKKNFEGKHGVPQRFHQFWLNFVGAFAGWFSLYLFLNILINIKLSEISVVHLLLFGFGIIGIVGWLPMTLLGVATSLGEIVNKILSIGKPKE